jgi:hypothetical protein
MPCRPTTESRDYDSLAHIDSEQVPPWLDPAPAETHHGTTWKDSQWEGLGMYQPTPPKSIAPPPRRYGAQSFNLPTVDRPFQVDVRESSILLSSTF